MPISKRFSAEHKSQAKAEGKVLVSLVLDTSQQPEDRKGLLKGKYSTEGVITNEQAEALFRIFHSQKSKS